ncbi:MAG: hypothetical protein FD167_1833, partial [bacterium]
MNKLKTSLCILLSLLLCPLWPIQNQAQTSGIVLDVAVEPGIFQTSLATSAIISITNAGGPNNILTSDRFSINFNTAFGTVTSIDPTILVASPSLSGFSSNQFTVSLSGSTITIVYTGPTRIFIPSDGFSVRVNFTTPPTVGQGQVLVAVTTKSLGFALTSAQQEVPIVNFSVLATGA